MSNAPYYNQQQQQPGYTPQAGTPSYNENAPMMGGQQPQYGQQPPMMGQQQPQYGQVVSNQVQNRYRNLWPRGVAIVDRQANPDECSCPPLCWCWNRPVFFSDVENRTYGQPGATCSPRVCRCGWEIENADVLGDRLTFEGRSGACCDTNSCWEPEVHVHDANRRLIGKSVMNCFICPCGEKELTSSFDANEKKVFSRWENPLCPFIRRYESDGCCGYKKIYWPITRATAQGEGYNSNNVVGEAFVRFHCCPAFHNCSFGISPLSTDPNSCHLTEDEQRLMFSIAVTRWWRFEQERQQNDGNGGN